MIINGIDTNDISVVVQGAIDQINTPKVCAAFASDCPEPKLFYQPGKEARLTDWIMTSWF